MLSICGSIQRIKIISKVILKDLQVKDLMHLHEELCMKENS